MSALREQTFDTIAQRVLYGFRFVLQDPDAAAPESQRQWQACVAELLNLLSNDPALLNLPLDADDSYAWYVVNNQRPELDAVYQKIFKGLHQFFHFLYGMGLEGTLDAEGFALDAARAKELKFVYKPSYAQLLSQVGLRLERGKEAFTLSDPSGGERLAAMRQLALVCAPRAPATGWTNKSLPLFDFIRCSWDGAYAYLLEKLDATYEYGGMLTALRETCLQRGYTPGVYAYAWPSGFSFSLEFSLGVGGFCMGYNPRKTQQFYFGTKNGIGEKKMLENFGSLDADMQTYFAHICRPCHGCLGCTKGGKSKIFTVTVNYQGTTMALCPQFPRHEWPEMDQNLIRLLLRYHALQNEYA